MSEMGISKPFYLESGNMNAKIYSKECIRKRLVQFIAQYHPDRDIIFWPDLASTHYASLTLQVFQELNIKFVPK